jgi:hypothetical protein
MTALDRSIAPYFRPPVTLARTRPVLNDRGSPRLLLSSACRRPSTLRAWVDEHAALVRETATRAGAVVLRGFDGLGPADFEAVATRIAGKLDRRDAEDALFRAQSALDVAPFGVGSVRAAPPRFVFLWTARPADAGGFTTLADARKVLADLDRKLVAPLLEEGLRVRREVSDARDGRRLADASAATPETRQPSVRWHPETGEKGFVNVLPALARSAADFASRPTGRRAATEGSEGSWEGAPRGFTPRGGGSGDRPSGELARRARRPAWARWIGAPEEAPEVRLGDGRRLAPEVVEHVRDVVERHTTTHFAHPGDILVVDAYASLIGRRAYRGPRDVRWLRSSP